MGATVTAEGKLRLDDGSEYSTPTAAARAVGGGSAGLTVWKRTSNGQKLSDVWKAYRYASAENVVRFDEFAVYRRFPIGMRAIRPQVSYDS